MKFLIFASVVTGVCFSLYGWGLLFHRLTKYPVRNWVVTITVGLCAIIFMGGVCNLIRCAYGWTFDSLLLIGIALAAKYNKFRLGLLRDKSKWFYVVVLGLLIAMIMNFTVKTQLPPKVFNCGDDFEKYFAHPVRMLQTGTLFGSPLSALGSQTLGGQAVLHGIVLNHFPVTYINGVDAVFGLFLCLVLSVSVVPIRATFLPIALISLLMVFFINPQYVNISTLYIASAFVMASILLFSDIGEYESERTENLPPPILIGLIYAALIAMKSIFVVFPLLHFSFFVITLGVFGVNIWRLARWSAVTATLTFLFLLPWLLLHLPNYVLLASSQTPYNMVVTPEGYPLLLSREPLRYGASFMHYTFINVAIAIPVLGIILWKHRECIRSRLIALAGLAASGAAIVAAYLLIFALGPILSDYWDSLRYAIPFLIAGVPIILSLVYFYALRDKSFGFKLSFSITPLLLGVIILISFSESLINRMRQGYESGSILAFSDLATRREYIKYSEEVIHGDTRSRIIAAQKQVPPGQEVVAWVNTPFYLDYKRNVIFDAEPGGIASPWAYIPDADYFIVEYCGFAVRSLNKYLSDTQCPARYDQHVAWMCIAFLQSIQEIGRGADELYNDGKIIVFKKHRE